MLTRPEFWVTIFSGGYCKRRILRCIVYTHTHTHTHARTHAHTHTHTCTHVRPHWTHTYISLFLIKEMASPPPGRPGPISLPRLCVPRVHFGQLLLAKQTLSTLTLSDSCQQKIGAKSKQPPACWWSADMIDLKAMVTLGFVVVAVGE